MSDELQRRVILLPASAEKVKLIGTVKSINSHLLKAELLVSGPFHVPQTAHSSVFRSDTPRRLEVQKCCCYCYCCCCSWRKLSSGPQSPEARWKLPCTAVEGRMGRHQQLKETKGDHMYGSLFMCHACSCTIEKEE